MSTARRCKVPIGCESTYKHSVKNRPVTRTVTDGDNEAAAAVGVYTLGRAGEVWTRSSVRWRVRDRLWQRPTPGVVVTHNGELSRDQLLWTAVLGSPPGAVLAAGTAAELGGLSGFADAAVTVTIPNSARKPLLPDGIRVLRSLELSELDVHPISRPPRTRMARSLLDMASTASSTRRGRAVLIAGCQQGLCQPRALSEALTRRGPCRHRRLIRETIADAGGGVDSLPESDFDTLCSRLGLPPPSRQRLLRRPDGHYYLDRYWAAFDLCCEVHGIPHMRVEQWDADIVRQNEIVIAGPRLLVFTSYAIRHMKSLVCDQIMRFVRAKSRAA